MKIRPLVWRQLCGIVMPLDPCVRFGCIFPEASRAFAKHWGAYLLDEDE